VLQRALDDRFALQNLNPANVTSGSSAPELPYPGMSAHTPIADMVTLGAGDRKPAQKRTFD